MKQALIILAIAPLAACGGLIEPLSAEQRLARSVDNFNNSWERSDIARQLPGSKMAARIDNGDTLVLMVDNLPVGNRTFDPNAVRKTMRPTLCDDSDFRELMDAGIKVRFEMTSNFGKPLPAVQFARCG